MDRRSLLGIAVGAGLLPAIAARADVEPEVIDLWPGLPPGAPAVLPVEQIKEFGPNDRAIKGIARPRLELFRPAKPNGAAMIVIPGGGYEWVGMEKEGYDIARWLADAGYAAFVLFYRLPGEGWADRENTPLADAQRAMRLVRTRAEAYGVDEARIGVMGFSAGGHLCADLVAHAAHRAYSMVDDADAFSAQPFLFAPIYPVISMSAPYAHPGSRDHLLGPNPIPEMVAAHSPDRNMPDEAPPAFIVHADEDFVPTENSLLLHVAMRARKRPVELHIFGEGGHGFALRNIAGKPVAAWPDLFLRFASAMGLVPR